MMFCSILVNSVARNLWNSLLRLVIWLFDLRGNLTKFWIYENEKYVSLSETGNGRHGRCSSRQSADSSLSQDTSLGAPSSLTSHCTSPITIAIFITITIIIVKIITFNSSAIITIIILSKSIPPKSYLNLVGSRSLAGFCKIWLILTSLSLQHE